jgi:hypothetical protein
MLRVIHLFHTRFSLLTESAKPKVPSMEKTDSQLWQAHWPRPEDRLDEFSQLSPASCLASALRLLLSEWARSGFVNAKRCGAKFAVLCLAAPVSTGIVSAQVGANLEEIVQESSGPAIPRQFRGVSSLGPADAEIRSTALDLRVLEGEARFKF